MAPWHHYTIAVPDAIARLSAYGYTAEQIGERLYVYADGLLIERIWIKRDKVQPVPIGELISYYTHNN